MNEKSEKLDWDNVRIFVIAAELGSFGKAAAQTGLTQPTVSRRIEQLEQQIGAKLFNRTSSGATLTSTGNELLESARRMAMGAEAIEKRLSESARQAKGRIKIRVPDVLASCVVMPALDSLLQENPELSVVIDCNVTALDDTSPDLIVSFLDPEDHDLTKTPLCWVHYSFFASPEYLKVNGTPKSMAECATRRILHHTAYYEFRQNWAKKTDAIDILIEDNLMVICDSGPLNIQAIQNGIGLGALPTIVTDSIPGLVPLDLGAAGKGRLNLYQRSGEDGNIAIDVCSKWLKKIFSDNCSPWLAEEFNDPYENKIGRHTPSN